MTMKLRVTIETGKNSSKSDRYNEGGISHSVKQDF